MRENPGTGKTLMKYSFAAGLVAGLHGYCVGLWRRMPAAAFFISQTMIGSCVAFGFFSVRYTILSEKLKSPRSGEPVKEVLVTSISAGIATGSYTIFTGGHVLTSITGGLIAGFLGHFVVEQVRIKRLEFLLKQNHPELMSQLKDAEDYMDREQMANPHYSGPVRPTPWHDAAVRYWEDFKRERQRAIDASMAKMEKNP